MRRLLKIVFWLIVLQVGLAICWPQKERDKAAASMAHSICSLRPQPEECGPNGHPWDPIRRLIEDPTGGTLR